MEKKRYITTKASICKTLVISTMISGKETCSLTLKQESKVIAAEIICYRKIAGKTMKDRYRNRECRNSKNKYQLLVMYKNATETANETNINACNGSTVNCVTFVCLFF